MNNKPPKPESTNIKMRLLLLCSLVVGSFACSCYFANEADRLCGIFNKYAGGDGKGWSELIIDGKVWRSHFVLASGLMWSSLFEALNK